MQPFKDKIKQLLANFWHFLRYLGYRYKTDGCQQSAAALTYTSLFAVVPMLTLMYSMFSLVPAFQSVGAEVENWVFSNFLPSSGQEITQYLREFSVQARKLSFAGGVILVVTAYLMLSNIEKSFNHIWSTPGSRRGLMSFLIYWAILSLGPLLLGAGMVINTYLLSIRLIFDENAAIGFVGQLYALLPWLLTWVAFTLLFVAVPNCRVNARYAAIGGLMTTLMFQGAKALFGGLVSYTSYNNVYGAFAVIPLFLIWIYLLWVIILLGAELVRSLETFRYEGRGKKLPDVIAVLVVLWQCWRRQQKGQALSDKTISRIGMDGEHWRHLRNLLLELRVLEKTASGQFVLLRDLSSVSIGDVIGWLGHNFLSEPQVGSERLLSVHPWYPEYEALATQSRSAVDERFSLSVAHLFHLGEAAVKEGAG